MLTNCKEEKNIGFIKHRWKEKVDADGLVINDVLCILELNSSFFFSNVILELNKQDLKNNCTPLSWFGLTLSSNVLTVTLVVFRRTLHSGLEEHT